jgi:hypothetical protein
MRQLSQLILLETTPGLQGLAQKALKTATLRATLQGRMALISIMGNLFFKDFIHLIQQDVLQVSRS